MILLRHASGSAASVCDVVRSLFHLSAIGDQAQMYCPIVTAQHKHILLVDPTPQVLASETFERQLPRQFRDCLPTVAGPHFPASSQAARHRNRVTSPQAASSPEASRAHDPSPAPATAADVVPGNGSAAAAAVGAARPGSVPAGSPRHRTYSFSPPAVAAGAVTYPTGAQRSASACAMLPGSPSSNPAWTHVTASLAATMPASANAASVVSSTHAGGDIATPGLAKVEGPVATVSPHPAAPPPSADSGMDAGLRLVKPSYNLPARPPSAVPPALLLAAFSPPASPAPPLSSSPGAAASPGASTRTGGGGGGGAAGGWQSPVCPASCRVGSARRRSPSPPGPPPTRIAAACTLLARAARPSVLVQRPPSAGGVMLQPAGHQPPASCAQPAAAAPAAPQDPRVRPVSPATTAAAPAPARLPPAPTAGGTAPLPRSSPVLVGLQRPASPHMAPPPPPSPQHQLRQHARPHSSAAGRSHVHPSCTSPSQQLSRTAGEGPKQAHDVTAKVPGAGQLVQQAAVVEQHACGAVPARGTGHAAAGCGADGAGAGPVLDSPCASWAYGGITAGMGVASTQALASLSSGAQLAPASGASLGLVQMVRQGAPGQQSSKSSGGQAKSGSFAHATSSLSSSRNGWHAPGTMQHMSELVASRVRGAGESGIDLSAVHHALLMTKT